MFQLNKNRILLLSGILPFFFVGCASKTPDVNNNVVIKRVVVDELHHKKTTYPVLKENNLGQRAVVDMGVVLKTRVTSYKDNNGDLIASHDVYFWARKPDFITTNTLPRKKDKNVYSGLKIDLSKAGLVDMQKNISEDAQKRIKEAEYNKKISNFIKQEK